MNAKRTCGECEHFPGTERQAGYCDVKLPMWLPLIAGSYVVHHDTDATHCETFTLKQTRKEENTR